MSKSIRATLEKSGYDTNGYLSLHIKKGDLPHGGDVVVMVRDAKTGDLHPISLEQRQNKHGFAQNSRFYEQVMADGHLFNPYIHRRYIAAQFRRLIQVHGCQWIKQGVASSYTWDYAVDILRKEVHRLANLEKYDRSGFAERSQFFTQKRCAQFLNDYAEAVSQYIDKAMGCRDRAFIPGCKRTLLKSNVRPMKYRFTKLGEQAGECKNYRQLDVLLDQFEWLPLPKELCLPDSFVEPFVESGAYYTMKHHIMFEGLRIWGHSQPDSLASLRNFRGTYLGLYQSVMK